MTELSAKLTQPERNSMTQSYLNELGFNPEKMKVLTSKSGENSVYVYLESEPRMTKKLSAFIRDLGYVIHMESNSKFGRKSGD